MSVVLSEHLPLLASAPDGIQKLRGLILELAVRGKLVPQDPGDEPASELLKRIAKERARLEAEGVCKKSKAVPVVGEDERPFELPAAWKWVRLGALGLIGSSSRVHQKDWTDRGVPFYRAREIVKLSQNGLVQNELYISEALYESLATSSLVPTENDLMVTGVGTIGVPYIVKDADKFYFKDASVLIFKNYHQLCAEYIRFFMKSPYWVEQIHEKSMGTTVHTLTIVRANEVPVPLPPLAEQHRIVAKVDELMALCDRLEAEQADADAAHARLVETLLGTLSQSADASELAANWQRLAEHFDSLFTTEAAIDALKQTVLQLAAMGKLVPQDPKDEPASELLKRIAKERARLEAEGICKKSKAMPVVGEDEQPFDAPDAWQWQRLDELLIITGGVTLGRKLSGRELISRPYLRVANVQRGHLLLEHMKTIEIPTDELGKYRLQSNDLLITEGGDWDKVGRTAIWRNEIDDCLHQNHVFRARPIADEWNCRWTEMYLNAKPARDYFAASSKQTTNLASINMTQLKGCLFPVPPLAEQHRIVAKVDELMALCDRLKADLAESRSQQARLASTLIEAALEAA